MQQQNDQKRPWAPFAVLGIIMATVIGIGTALSWISDIRAVRLSIAESEEAQCSDAETDCAYKDLPAQVRTAAAAEAMVDLTIIQLLLGAVSLAAILYALKHSWQSASYAREAATHSRRQADVAERQLMDAGRPHLIFQEVTGEKLLDDSLPLSDLFSVWFRAVNFGDGPG